MRRKDDVVVIEKRYGCYRAGVLFSLVLILILVVIICIPPILSVVLSDANQELNTYVLIALIIVFVLLGCAIVTFINYQHRQAFKQRMQSENGIYTLQKARLRRGESTPNANVTELQKLKLDLNANEKNVPSKK